MDRRQFILKGLLFSAALGYGTPLGFPRRARAAAGPLLGVAHGPDYKKIVAGAIGELGGMKHFVRRGDKVVIKPNIGWDRKVEQGANTHPLVVRGLIELSLDAGASQILIFDRTCNEKRRCYVSSGISEMVAKLGESRVKLNHMDDRKFVEMDIPKGESLTRWEIYKEVVDADCYINVPVAKHHGLSRLTLGLKNSMGVIGGNRGRLHHDLGQRLADLATLVRPRLTVIDATRMLMRNGPQGGRVSDVKIMDTVVASADPVAADAYATTLFGLSPDVIGSTVAASKMGLGEMSLARMQIREVTL